MKVVVCGAGQVGLGIAERLATEGNDVSIVEQSPALVQRANDVLDVRAIQGNGAHPDALVRAGIASADMLIAVTLSDEVNMIACQIAHSLFETPTKIARVRAQTYLDKQWTNLFSRESIPIDYTISPEIEVGNVVMRRLALPGAFETASFAEGRVLAIGVNCGADCPIVNTRIRQLAELFPDLPATIVAIVRQGRLLTVNSDTALEVSDDVYVVLPAEQVSRTLKIFGHEETQARRIIIAGGGNIGLFVAQAIEEREQNVRVKIIENRRERAVQIAETLQRSVVLNGDALSEELLREADVAAAETLVAVTNNDQVNILTSVLAKQLGCQRSLCLVNSPGYTNMVRSFGVDAQVNPRGVTVSRILQYVRRGRIRAVQEIHDGAGEIIEAEALETTPVVGRPIRDLDLSPGVRFGAILRQGKIIQPLGDTELQPRDRVILHSPTAHIREVEQLFRVSPDYL
jgi:trk system potassium uptake protein TrkA